MNRESNSLNILRTFLIFIIGFLTGFLTFVNLTKFEIISFLPEDIGEIPIVKENLSDDLDFTKLEVLYKQLKARYYSIEGIDKEKLIDGAAKGLVKGLGDMHTVYFTKEENKSFMDSLNGSFEGIGAVIEKVDSGIRIVRILKGSPAKKYGLLKGDIILNAGGNELAPLDQNEAVSHIKGPAGSEVTLKIYRKGELDYIYKDVIRERIDLPSVQSEIKDNYGYVSINTFGERTSVDFYEALNKITSEDIDGLIIDLRDNGGGYLQSSVEILSNFVKNGELLVTVKNRAGFGALPIQERETYHSLNEGEIFDKPIVVLINENSASASEITAGALSELNKAILVGVKSFGKGSVQEPVSLSDGSLLKLTTAKWFTPKDNNIDGEGIEPDILIDFTKEDLENLKDVQLEKAVETLQDFIKTKNIENTISNLTEIE